MANETVAAWGHAIGKMDSIDFVRSGALLVAFLACGFADRRGQGSAWLHADQIATAAFGAGLVFFPQTILAYVMEGKADWVHAALMQAVGLTLLACAATWWMSSRSREATTCWSIARILSCLALLQVLYYSEWKYGNNDQKLTTQHHTFATFGSILLTIGHFLCVVRVYGSGNERNIPRQWTRENACLFFVVIFLLLDTFCMFARPHHKQQYIAIKDWKIDGVHLYLVRVGATQLMSLFFFAVFGLINLPKRDKVAVLVSCLMFYGAVFPGMVYYQWIQPFINPSFTTPTWVSLGLVIGVCAFGSFRELKDNE